MKATRPYLSPLREASASQTRERIINSAEALLADTSGITQFSLDAVAKRTGIARTTVYKHFGSRRALLEAVLDNVAERGGLYRIGQALAHKNPQEAMRLLVKIFCDFWSADTVTIVRLHAASAFDPDFDVTMRSRNERRRKVLTELVARMAAQRSANAKSFNDLIDVLFALTSHSFYAQLRDGGRTKLAVDALIQKLCQDVLQEAGLFSNVE